MCLIVDSNTKAKKPNKDGFCVGWKVLSKNNTSPYRRYPYNVGVIVDPNRESPSTAEYSFQVNEGLHLFLTRKEARREVKTFPDSSNHKIVKVFYKPEDVIAYGFFRITWSGPLAKCVAVKILTIKSLKDVG